MKQLLMIYGCVLVASTAVAEIQQSTNSFMDTKVNAIAKDLEVFHKKVATTDDTYELNLSEIQFIEEDSEVVLGFDTEDYLPEDFDPYERYFDLSSVAYIEDENALQLDFDATYHLPEGFDPYAEEVSIHSINYVEDETLKLGFDTTDYLPEGFSPFEVYFDLNSIEYIEDEEDIQIEFHGLCQTFSRSK
ncbi:hypothetical protein KIM67_03060 [Flagellimonas sp. 389]|uniref:hypothetical protein n=1 Tax=Flagellimonas sp. 389 TaxID=2835862 RepID=UPI001BD25E47|nr:hypothetical protein [Flagellimonas sp. 389]MBS9461375.1 hypothetical protein [Flagellimonas sp. 389]